MSQLLINQYLNELQRLRKISGTKRETVVREAFKDLLKAFGKNHDLQFIAEYQIVTPAKNLISVDGALLHSLRVPFGYWEAKDEEDDLDEEIAKKFKKGYPRDNIIFEDSTTAVLIQNGAEIQRCAVNEPKQLEKLLKLFLAYERLEIAEFRKAVAQFKADMPAVLSALREMIDTAEAANADFRQAQVKFLKHAKETINPAVTEADVREMLIQHILTEEIFSKVFDESDFHRQNNVAKELYTLEAKFFTGTVKKNTLKGLEPYYAAIRATAALISTHSEKQAFLKVIYENFYKVYNPKAADRLGVIYTPNEIVRFMVESADWLCQKHFDKSLIDKGVEILDPAAGTGTFITELLEHFRGQPKKLAQKYKDELHANEVAILPYYVANLNIEATYAAITRQYLEFENLCFVDTLDNVAGLGKFSGYQGDMFGAMSEENVERITRQNKRKISVIIGNPPYNANQQNENDNNKNRTYRRVDERIKATYIKQSTAQKTKRYDMYSRFFRWASDRLKDDGIIAFITNRNFIDSKEADGFRKLVTREFDEIWIVDLGGDWKKTGNEGGNVFNISTGVAISFLIKKTKNRIGGQVAPLFYACPEKRASRDDKLAWLSTHTLKNSLPENIKADNEGYWIDTPTSQSHGSIPIANKETKLARTSKSERAVFKLFSLGVVTNRDEWVWNESSDSVRERVSFLVKHYNSVVDKLPKSSKVSDVSNYIDKTIKWTRSLKGNLAKRNRLHLNDADILRGLFRPFVKKNLYFNKFLNEMQYQTPAIFVHNQKNPAILFSSGARGKFQCFATLEVPSLDLFLPDACQIVSLTRFDEATRCVENITDWALEQFRAHYETGNAKPKRPITKDAIFHYVYAVLHDPVYREKYAQNLKREFPRIPFYPDFWAWADWGAELMQLHIGYETVEPCKLERIDTPDEKSRTAGYAPKTILKAGKEHGIIVLDSETQLSGVPKEAWDYRLGNRSALEWILDQYKEKTPKDPTIREKFNTYRFAEYKEKVVDLIARVTRVSVETQRIVEAMKGAIR